MIIDKNFKFGLEVEYIIFQNTMEKSALWADDLNFNKIYQIIKNIPFLDVCQMDGIDPEEAHDEISPFVIEGYHLKHEDGRPAKSMLVKGVEIRTPVCSSIDECINIYEILLKRLKKAMQEHGLYLSSIAHHPTATKFEAERMGRRHDFWNWAKVAMKTYGPDINISFPKDVEDKIFNNLDSFHERVNYYAPAMSALTLCSPFFDGGLKYDNNQVVLSHRTLRRSPVAPAIEAHFNENGRMEFKFFEMAKDAIEYRAMFLLCLVLSLATEDELPGMAEAHERIYALGEVAKKGLNAHHVNDVLNELKQVSFQVLNRYGFDYSPLEIFWERFHTGILPGHQLIEAYQSNKTMLDILKSRIPGTTEFYV